MAAASAEGCFATPASCRCRHRRHHRPLSRRLLLRLPAQPPAAAPTLSLCRQAGPLNLQHRHPQACRAVGLSQGSSDRRSAPPATRGHRRAPTPVHVPLPDAPLPAPCTLRLPAPLRHWHQALGMALVAFQSGAATPSRSATPSHTQLLCCYCQCAWLVSGACSTARHVPDIPWGSHGAAA